MSLAKLHDRLEHRFGLLTGGSRVALPRQQTLRGLVDWSFDLLTGPEQALFRRSSVFVDGFVLEAAEGVCALEDIPDWDVADLLASLVDKSLVVAEPHGDDVRYRLQETLRQYGAGNLAEVGAFDGDDLRESDRVVTAHAEFYLAFAEQAAPHLPRRSAIEWTARLDDEQLNLRSAIEHQLGTPEGAERSSTSSGPCNGTGRPPGNQRRRSICSNKCSSASDPTSRLFVGARFLFQVRTAVSDRHAGPWMRLPRRSTWPVGPTIRLWRRVSFLGTPDAWP